MAEGYSITTERMIGLGAFVAVGALLAGCTVDTTLDRPYKDLTAGTEVTVLCRKSNDTFLTTLTDDSARRISVGIDYFPYADKADILGVSDCT